MLRSVWRDPKSGAPMSWPMGTSGARSFYAYLQANGCEPTLVDDVTATAVTRLEVNA